MFLMLFLLLVEIICNFVTKVLVKAFLKSLSPASKSLVPFPGYPFPGLSTGYYCYVKNLELKRDETTVHHA